MKRKLLSTSVIAIALAIASILSKPSSNVEVFPSTTIIASAATSSKISLSACTVSVDSQIYSGAKITPAIDVKHNGKQLYKGKDYTVSFSNNVNAGTATATLKGKGNFTGTKKVSFTISKLNLKDCSISVANATYTGKAVKPKVTVKFYSRTIPTKNYTVTYSNNNSAGIGTATITGKNSTFGTVSVNFNISEKKKKPSITSTQITSNSVVLKVKSYSSDSISCIVSRLGIELPYANVTTTQNIDGTFTITISGLEDNATHKFKISGTEGSVTKTVKTKKLTQGSWDPDSWGLPSPN